MAGRGATGLLLLAAALLCATASQTVTASEVTGVIQSPALASTVVQLYTTDGEKRVAFLGPDGRFRIPDVPPGQHLLHVHVMGAYFPEVLIDVGKAGVRRATLVAQGPQGSITQALPLPLALRPVGEMGYFEKRKPVDVWSFVKSPYGLMIVFSLFIIVVMPRLKVDPEEYKSLQATMRGGSSGGDGGQRTIAAAAR